MAGKTKSEASKSDSKIPRSYRKSPSRMDASGDAKSAPKSPSRATATTKSPVKPKSPARTKSPVKAKSPARTKSPSRKSPAREKPSPPKSPARGRPRKNSAEVAVVKTAKSSTTQAASTPASKSKPIPVLIIDTDSDSDYGQDISSEKPKARVQGRTRRATDITSKLIETAHSSSILSRASREDSAMRRSARLYNTGNAERTIHLKSHYEPIVKLSEFSDDDDLVHKTSKAPQSSSKTPFPAILGNAIFAGIFPTIMIILNAACTEKNCKFQLPQLAPLLKLSTYYHPMTFISSVGFILLVTVLTVLPIGGRIIKGMPSNIGQLTYCTNGLFVMSVTLALAAVAQWYNVQLLSFIREHWMHLNVTFLVLCFLVAIMLYVKGRSAPLSQQNQQGTTSSALINFIEGKEVNPRLFGFLDVKYVMYRTAFISFILLNVLFTYASLSQPFPTPIAAPVPPTNVPWPLSLITSHINIQPTILTLTTMQLIYFLDMFVFERTFVTSYEIQYAGTGLLKCFEVLGGIFTYTLVGRYVLDNNVQLAWWKLVLSLFVFLVGYVFYRGSNLQKHTFRVNPYNPKISHYESIPTTMGRKLLISGFWGVVRHPNYLGDILIHLAHLPFVCCAPPCIVLYLMMFSLVARAYSDNERCKTKYGASWERYCQRVKYILLPKLY